MSTGALLPARQQRSSVFVADAATKEHDAALSDATAVTTEHVSAAFTAAEAKEAPADGGGKGAHGRRPRDVQMVPLSALFRHAERGDWALLCLGAVMCGGLGLTMPLYSIVFGNILSSLNGGDVRRAVEDEVSRAWRLSP